MQGQHITLRKQGILIHLFIFRHLAFPRNRMENNPAAECFRNFCNSSADIAHTHDAPSHAA